MHIWSVLGSRLELRFYFECGKHRERAGILVQNEVHSEKYSNKAVQTDNSRAVRLVVSLSLNFTTRQTARELRLTAALYLENGHEFCFRFFEIHRVIITSFHIDLIMGYV